MLPDPFDVLKAVIGSFTYLCFIYVSCQQFSLSTAQIVMMMNKQQFLYYYFSMAYFGLCPLYHHQVEHTST